MTKGKPTELTVIRQQIAELETPETKLKWAEEQLEKRLWRGMIEQSPDCICAVDMKGVIIWCNTALARTLGYSRDEIIGRHFSKLRVVLPRDLFKYGKLFRSAMAGKPAGPFEVDSVHKDGTLLVFDVRLSLLKAGGRTILMTVARDVTERKQMEARDITERRRMEEELRRHHDHLEELVEKRTAELARANKELRADFTERERAERKMVEYKKLDNLKSNLLSTVSHELRTPLAAIKGYATMLLDYDQKLGRDEKREQLKSIDRSVDRLTELIDCLLDMSRLDAGLMKLEKAPADISQIIWEAVLEAQIRESEHKILVHAMTGLPRVNIDAKRIRQVLDNLLDNAIKYSRKGSSIAVEASTTESELLIEVTDQGIGIPTEHLERVFERMYRIEQGTFATEAAGIGLGLSLCKGLVEAHGGRIWMESEEEQGSKCTFTLPL